VWRFSLIVAAVLALAHEDLLVRAVIMPKFERSVDLIYGKGAGPPKAELPLIVNANAELSRPAALQGFQSIVRRDLDIIEPTCDFELTELSPCHLRNIHEAPDSVASCECLGIRAFERSDHAD
jgi:hypothetical protein